MHGATINDIPYILKSMMTTEINRWIGGRKSGLKGGWKMDGSWTELKKILYRCLSENVL